MLSQIYTIFFVVSILMLICLVAFFQERISVYYILLFCGVTVSNFGYMQLVSAQELQTALFANQAVYLGSSFTPFFLLMCMADLCKIKVPKMAEILFLVYGFSVFGLTSSIGTFDLYYKDVTLVRENGITFLEKNYGPLHNMFPFYLMMVMLIGMIFILRSFKQKKEVSYHTSLMLLICSCVTILTYVIEKTMGIKIELLPVAYAFSQLGVLLLLRRISLYDVSAISTDSMVESLSHGFLISDSKGRYLGSDEAAKHWFPEILELKVDQVVKEEATPFLLQIGKWNREEDENEIALIPCGDLIIEAQHTILAQKGEKTIHCVYLRDDTKQQQYLKLVEQYNENLEKDVNAKTKKLRKVQSDIIVSMASIVENRDSNTGGHIARTSDVVGIFVKYLRMQNIFPNLTKETAACIRKAAPLHDFGKIAIPDVVLNKPGKFTDEEYEQMKQHSAKGAVIVERILQNSEDEVFKRIAVNVAHYHHEKWDGSGYPNHIKGEEIPFEARVMALADVFDALVSKRVYKEKFSYDKAFQIVEESSGSHFEPVLCKAFLECREQLINLYDSYGD